MSKRVLIVDDHTGVRRMMRLFLESQGFEVIDAVNGVEGIEKAKSENPDLIVLDLSMPVMNGLDAARQLKSLMPQVPLLMFTNTVGSALEQHARSVGISAVVAKTDSLDQLLVHANELLKSA